MHFQGHRHTHTHSPLNCFYSCPLSSVPFYSATSYSTEKLTPTLCLNLLFSSVLLFIAFWCLCDVASLFLLCKTQTKREDEKEGNDEKCRQKREIINLEETKGVKSERIKLKKKDFGLCYVFKLTRTTQLIFVKEKKASTIPGKVVLIINTGVYTPSSFAGDGVCKPCPRSSSTQ